MVGCQKVNHMVEMLQDEGYVFAYHPKSSDPDREVVYVSDDEPMAVLLRQTYAASVEGKDVAEFSRQKFRRFEIGRVFRVQGARLITGNEGESTDVLMQIRGETQ